MIVHFDSKYLPVLSMDEAILYGHIEFLSVVNKVSGLNFFDDYYWVLYFLERGKSKGII